MKSASSTETTKVYREAARIIEKKLHPESVGGWSCLAIAKARRPNDYTGHAATDGFYYGDLPEVEAYEAMFLQDGSFGYERAEEGNAHRVVALCFMAAMVEAGDA